VGPATWSPFVADSEKLWEAWRLSKAYRCRPSELYGIQDAVTAWSFDRACWLFGSQLDAELAEAEQGAKSKSQANGRRQRVIAKWLGGKQQFRDPVASGSGTVSSKGAGPVKL
jgi:hypothetical protein